MRIERRYQPDARRQAAALRALLTAAPKPADRAGEESGRDRQEANEAPQQPAAEASITEALTQDGALTL